VNLRVRSGAEDVASEIAEQWGRSLVDATAAVEPGTDLVVSLFDAGDGLHLRVVADDPQVALVARDRDWGAGTELEIKQYAEQLLVKVGPA
jgi:hypothetical protein